jgi:hypothetical protein
MCEPCRCSRGSADSTSASSERACPACSSARSTSTGDGSSPGTGPTFNEPTTSGTWRLTESQKQEATRRYEAGESCGAIAKDYRVSRQSMWDVLRRRTEMRTRERHGADNHFYRGGSRAVDAAQNKLEKAIQRGEITRPDECSRCGTAYRFKDGRTAIQAHHPDYTKPLDVIWLCQRCHHEEHKEVMPMEAERGLISSAEASRERAKTSPSPADAEGSTGTAPACSSSSHGSQMSFAHDGSWSRTSQGFSPLPTAETLPSFSARWPTSGMASPGGYLTLDSSESPNGAVECSLSDILEATPSPRYGLSARAARGILRRAAARGRTLPAELEAALTALAATATTPDASLPMNDGTSTPKPSSPTLSPAHGRPPQRTGPDEEPRLW